MSAKTRARGAVRAWLLPTTTTTTERDDATEYDDGDDDDDDDDDTRESGPARVGGAAQVRTPCGIGAHSQRRGRKDCACIRVRAGLTFRILRRIRTA